MEHSILFIFFDNGPAEDGSVTSTDASGWGALLFFPTICCYCWAADVRGADNKKLEELQPAEEEEIILLLPFCAAPANPSSASSVVATTAPSGATSASSSFMSIAAPSILALDQCVNPEAANIDPAFSSSRESLHLSKHRRIIQIYAIVLLTLLSWLKPGCRHPYSVPSFSVAILLF